MDCFAADRCGINGKIKKFKTSKPEDCVFWNKLNTLAHETLMLKRNFDLVGRKYVLRKTILFWKNTSSRDVFEGLKLKQIS